MGRSHPVLLTFATGATLGFSIAATLMFTVGHIKVLTNDLLLMLWPTSIFGIGSFDGPRAFTIFVLIVELVSNAVLYGIVFAAPVRLAVAGRRSFGKPEKPTSIGSI